MATKKKDSTLLKEANGKIADLEKKIELLESDKSMYYKQKQDLEKEIESVHTALDTMYVPRKVKVGYSEQTMTVASRLFAWQCGARIKPTDKTEIE